MGLLHVISSGNISTVPESYSEDFGMDGFGMMSQTFSVFNQGPRISDIMGI